jgi:hypothetical protein
VRTHYDNLKVVRDAPIEVIEAAYVALYAKYNPDRNPYNAMVPGVTKIIQRSYDVLSDPAKRAMHDRWIAEAESRSPPSNRAPLSTTTNIVAAADRVTRWALWGGVSVFVLSLAVAAIFLPAPAPSASKTNGPSPAPTGKQPVDYDELAARFGGKDVPPGSALAREFQAHNDPPIKLRRAVPTQEPPPQIYMVPQTTPEPKVYTAAPKRLTYRRPDLGPDGNPWPDISAYLLDQAEDGNSKVTVDNTQNSSDMLVELFDFGVAPPKDVRAVFLRAREQFALRNVRPGAYDIRYQNLDSGIRWKSQPHGITEDKDYSLTLYTVPSGNDEAVTIGPNEFDSTFLQGLPYRP